MAKPKSGSKDIYLFVVVSLLFLLFIYKWLEYSSLKYLVNVYDSSVTQELAITSDINRQFNDAYVKIKDFYASASQEASIQFEAYENLAPAVDLYRSGESEYSNLLTENSRKFSNLNTILKFFFGSKVSKAKNIVTDHLEYYETEIRGNKNNLIETSYFKNLFLVFNDMNRVSYFDTHAKNKSEIKENYFLLSSIKKYTENSFKFYDEDSIRNYAPEEFKELIKYKRYFATYYELIKLVLKDQETSQNAVNLANKLNQDSLNINIDFQGLFKDKEEKKLDNTKKTISLITDELRNIYEINDDSILSYPFVKPLTFKKHYLWHCQLYDYKSGFYNSYKKEFPEAKNAGELISALSTLSPKTDVIDDQFNKKVLILENTPTEFNMTCVDKENNDKYVYKLTK